MATVYDVAAYILTKKNTLTAVKLQKLVYYAQAWSIVWDEQPLFPERIEAWVNGPVVPELYDYHRGQFTLESLPLGNPDSLTETQRETIDEVLNFYGDKSSQWLSELTHKETPWLEARQGLAPGERGNQEIPLAAMAEYYESL